MPVSGKLFHYFSGGGYTQQGSAVPQSGTYHVDRVIDGDTIVLDGGVKVRYVGIDAPEEGEDYYGEARDRNSTLVLGKFVNLKVCESEPLDMYGRTLGWVSAGGSSVNGTLLSEGLARELTIAPCGLVKMLEYRGLADKAKKGRIGIWSLEGEETAGK